MEVSSVYLMYRTLAASLGVVEDKENGILVEIESRNLSSALQLNELDWGRGSMCKHVSTGN